MTCPSCNSSSIKCNGHIHNGKKNHRCLECGRQFVLESTQKRVYLHLLKETKFHIIEMETYLAKDDHAAENMTDHAKIWFQNNDFPNAKLIGFSNPPQPASKSKLLEAMVQLKIAINHMGEAVSTSNHTGKTQHPGHGYFNAAEWFQYAEMHCRHHLLQKARIMFFTNVSFDVMFFILF